MTPTTMKTLTWKLGILLLGLAPWASNHVAGAEPTNLAGGPLAIPTFHCLGLYWSPPGGAANREVQVRYRRQGTTEWKEGLSMRYNPIAGTDEDLADYRGSVVHLTPATTYDVQLTLVGTATVTNLVATTWSEEFPVGATVRGENRDTPLAITESGTPRAYRVYDGRGVTIDVRHQHDSCITINASNVIVRGFTLRGAGTSSGNLKRSMGAIQIEGGQNIILEDCDISDWGRQDPATHFGKDYDAAVFSRSATLQRLIIQRCKMHHPTWDGSTWYEPTYPTHTMGPQCITLFNAGGNHVIRYNEFWSDMEHMYNDIVGGGSNGSFRGAPGPDSDIYGNLVSHCWDDGLEVEGGSRNVRVWGNYITQCMNMIGNAPASIGPLYIWRNVVTRSQSQPGAGGMHFLKMGYADGEQWMTGQMYIFHNTLFRSDEWLPTGGLGGNRIVKHTMSRNNILQVRAAKDYSASENKQNSDNDFDYDLYSGRIPSGQERHGQRGEPAYATHSGFDPATLIGRFQLASESPGAGGGEVIPNFSDGYTGSAPDIGAHQRGAPPMRFGVVAASATVTTSIPAEWIDQVTDAAELPVETNVWGTLQWLMNGKLSPGAAQTVGIATILPGARNPLHFHPNCEEVLYVISGRGRQSYDGRAIELKPGMTIRIPSGVKHNMVNSGSEALITVISFSNGDRKTVFLETQPAR